MPEIVLRKKGEEFTASLGKEKGRGPNVDAAVADLVRTQAERFEITFRWEGESADANGNTTTVPSHSQ